MSNSPDFDVIRVLAGRWKTMLVFAVIGAAAGVAYGLLSPNWYAATLTVIPSQRGQDTAAMAIAARIPAAPDRFRTDVQRIQAGLRSSSVADEVIAKFNLQTRYGRSHPEHTRAELWQHCSTTVDRKSGLVSLTCEDKVPQFAKDMTTYFGEVGNKVFGRVSASSAREERTFLEQQVQKARADVDDASRKLRDFQERHKIIDLPEQTKAVISAMAQLKGEMLSKQLELSYLSGFSSRAEASVVQLQQQIAIMESKLKQLENSQMVQAGSSTPTNAGSAAKENFFPNAMNVPELRFELEQLMREQKIRETVFALMTQRFEMAKIDEARDTSTFQILDYPTLPTAKSRPRRTRIAATGVIAGLAASGLWILIPLWIRRRLGGAA